MRAVRKHGAETNKYIITMGATVYNCSLPDAQRACASGTLKAPLYPEAFRPQRLQRARASSLSGAARIYIYIQIFR